jgi:hypothetical protein
MSGAKEERNGSSLNNGIVIDATAPIAHVVDEILRQTIDAAQGARGGPPTVVADAAAAGSPDPTAPAVDVQPRWISLASC